MQIKTEFVKDEYGVEKTIQKWADKGYKLSNFFIQVVYKGDKYVIFYESRLDE